jgi:hypothetical protein
MSISIIHYESTNINIRRIGGIANSYLNALASMSGKEMPVKSNKNNVFPSRPRLENLGAVEG